MLALYLAACHTPEAATTVFKCSWGWTQKASETLRVILQLLINILPSCITLVLYIYQYTGKLKLKFDFAFAETELYTIFSGTQPLQGVKFLKRSGCHWWLGRSSNQGRSQSLITVENFHTLTWLSALEGVTALHIIVASLMGRDSSV